MEKRNKKVANLEIKNTLIRTMKHEGEDFVDKGKMSKEMEIIIFSRRKVAISGNFLYFCR